MYREGEQVTVRLSGGGPYGLRLRGGGEGGGSQPLIVAKLHKKSKARAAGVRVGDVVQSINSNRCNGMSLQTAHDLIEYSIDLCLQLVRISDDHDFSTRTSSFRQSQQPAFRSLSPFHYGSGSTSSAVNQQQSKTTELFHHKVQYDRQMSPSLRSQKLFSDASDDRFAWPVTSNEEELNDRVLLTAVSGDKQKGNQQQKQVIDFDFIGRRPEPGLAQATLEPSHGKEGKESVGLKEGIKWQKWMPDSSVGTKVPHEIAEWKGELEGLTSSCLASRDASSLSVQPHSSPSFLPKEAVPSKPNPPRWQPPDSYHATFKGKEIEPETLSTGTSRPDDGLVHEVVIWSSKQTNDDQRKIENSDRQKPLSWQPSQQSEEEAQNRVRPASVANISAPLSGEAKRWQPTTTTQSWKPDAQNSVPPDQVFQKQIQPSILDPSQPFGVGPVVSRATEKFLTPSPWLPSANQIEHFSVSDVTSKGYQPNKHRWQPGQIPSTEEEERVSHSIDKLHLLEEPRRSSHEGSSSPVVSSLFLTRVVTDGSAIMAASGSDEIDATNDDALPANHQKRLYGDSSFYEDPEHKYPTIVEQIKMARKVALLLTSPSNKNARGQRMFLKRKEQSSKWVTDISQLDISPPSHSLSHLKGSRNLSPEEVEWMRFHEDKSRHDVVPFDVCSMLAAELREERGRGGRLFAKRRHQADLSIIAESDGLAQVYDQPSPPRVRNRKFVPENVTKLVPSVTEEKSKVDTHPDLALPVNRLKEMVDPPKPRMTPWNSAAQYGTVELAFEHLKDYRPYEMDLVQKKLECIASVPLLESSRAQKIFHQNEELLNKTRGQKRDDFLDTKVPAFETPVFQHTSLSDAPGNVASSSGSSGFLRQTAGNRKGYRAVHFQVGARSFN